MDDTTQRQQLLQTKLRANAQRNARTFYLKILPPELGEYLQTCEFIQSPTMDDLLACFWQGKDELKQRSNYEDRELSWPHQIFEIAYNFDVNDDPTHAYFYPFGNCPIFCTTFGWVRQNIEVLFYLRHDIGHLNYTYSPARLAVVAMDLTAGITIDNYCGYLPEDPNPDEIVYKVTTWKSMTTIPVVR
jgi:hypothetical protein